MHYIHQVCTGSSIYYPKIDIVKYWHLIRKWATRKAGWDPPENNQFGSFYICIGFREERTHSRIRNPAWPIFLFLIRCPLLLSSRTIIIMNSWGVRMPNTHPTRGVRGLHEPMGCVFVLLLRASWRRAIHNRSSAWMTKNVKTKTHRIMFQCQRYAISEPDPLSIPTSVGLLPRWSWILYIDSRGEDNAGYGSCQPV